MKSMTVSVAASRKRQCAALVCCMGLALTACAKREVVPRGASVAAPLPVTAVNPASYPDALLGIWRLMPGGCDGVDNPDADGVLRIEADTAHGYESGYKPRAVETEVEGRRWRVSVEELYGGMPGTLEWQTITLEQDRLVIEGEGHREEYRRCPRR